MRKKNKEKDVKDNLIKNPYDERQILARYNAMKVGFITLCCWDGFSWVVSVFVENTFVHQSTWHVIGLIIALTTYNVVCIWKDAYYSFLTTDKNNQTKVLVLLFFTQLLSAVSLFLNDDTREMKRVYAGNFVISIGILIIIINLVIKEKVDKRNLQKVKKNEKS